MISSLYLQVVRTVIGRHASESVLAAWLGGVSVGPKEEDIEELTHRYHHCTAWMALRDFARSPLRSHLYSFFM
jgi:hypothetical protein